MFDHLALSLPHASALMKYSRWSVLWWRTHSRFPFLLLLQQAT
jgi:hypothetical protein